jgi:hypothetical protein
LYKKIALEVVGHELRAVGAGATALSGEVLRTDNRQKCQNEYVESVCGARF